MPEKEHPHPKLVGDDVAVLLGVWVEDGGVVQVILLHGKITFI